MAGTDPADGSAGDAPPVTIDLGGAARAEVPVPAAWRPLEWADDAVAYVASAPDADDEPVAFAPNVVVEVVAAEDLPADRVVARLRDELHQADVVQREQLDDGGLVIVAHETGGLGVVGVQRYVWAGPAAMVVTYSCTVEQLPDHGAAHERLARGVAVTTGAG